MTKNTMQKPASLAKQSYPELIKARAEKLYAQAGQAADSDAAVQMIYDALKTTALESWKNGLSAGHRRSKTKPADSTETA